MSERRTQDLTRKQREILQLIQSFTQAHGVAPTLRELMQTLGLSSPATLHKHIQNLKKAGHLQEQKRAWRNVRTVKSAKAAKLTPQAGQIPIIGSISRGEKSELYAQSSFFEGPKSWSELSRPVYGFVIRDNSFQILAMQRGDLLVVEARNEPRTGEMILVTSKETGSQIGRYIVTYTEQRLDLIDATFSFDKSDLLIQGVVISLIRKF